MYLKPYLYLEKESYMYEGEYVFRNKRKRITSILEKI
jgi:hypothetical protein